MTFATGNGEKSSRKKMC